MNTARPVILCLLLTASLGTSAQAKRTLNSTPMTADQIAVYQAFLTFYNNGSKATHLNLANRTSALDLPDTKVDGPCLQGIVLDDPSQNASIIHQFLSEHPKAAIHEHLKSGHTF